MHSSFFNAVQRSRPLDVTAIENALVDFLVRAEDSDLRQMEMKKGVMQLVDVQAQVRALAHLGKLTTEIELGGSAANALRGLAALGSKTSYSSCIGSDKYGASFSSRLEELDIRNRLAVVAADTGTCLVVVTPDGERTMNTFLGACREYRTEFVPLEDIENSKVFFTTGYMWDTANQIEAIEHALKVARKSGTKVALDLADPFVVSRHGARLHELLKGQVDIVFANGEEAHMLLGVRGAIAAHALSQHVEIAVVKDGANGAFIASQGSVCAVPAHNVSVVDTTGAGDMFAAGFLHGLVRELPIEVCGKMGAMLAADTITHMGVRNSPQIFERLKALGAT